MKQLVKALTLAVGVLGLTTAANAQQLACSDYDEVMQAFAEQGTIYRGRAEGPNHRLLEIFENEATGKGMAILHDTDNNRACAVAFGFDYEAFAARTTIINRPS